MLKEIVRCHNTDKLYKRIAKRTARKEYNNNKEVLLLPVNMRFGNYWMTAYSIKKCQENETFDNVINNYEYYNTCSERGYYTKYYIEIDKSL